MARYQYWGQPAEDAPKIRCGSCSQSTTTCGNDPDVCFHYTPRAQRFVVKVDCTNAAFSDDAGNELARILRELSERLFLATYKGEQVLRDINGNAVGFARFEE